MTTSTTNEYFLVYFKDSEEYSLYPHMGKLYTTARQAYLDLMAFMEPKWDPVTRTGYKAYRLDMLDRIDSHMEKNSELNIYYDGKTEVNMLKVYTC